MDSNLKILFYLKKPRNFTSGPIPIYLRITIDLLPKELSTGYSCLARHWDFKTKRVKNITAEDAKTNDALTHLEDKVKNNYRYLREMDPDLVITSCELKDRLKGKIPKAQTSLGVFREHNSKVKVLVGREFAAGTLERYETSLKHTADFISFKYKCHDLSVSRINHVFISEYDFYLRTVRKCNNNSTVKYMKNFKKIILICLASSQM